MGLVQLEIESAGISTICLSTMWRFTAAVGVPRLAAIEYPMGRPFGQPLDAKGQTEVLAAALTAFVEMEHPGAVVHLPFEWPSPPRQVRRESLPQEAPPIVKLLKRRPWLFAKLLSGHIPGK